MDGDVRFPLDAAAPGPTDRPLTRTDDRLTVRRTLDDEVLVLHVGGVVDTITAPSLGTHLEIALTAEPPLLIVDLTEVVFLSAAGINLLIDVQRLTEGFTTEMRVVARGPVTSRPLRVLGVDAYLNVYPDVPAARRR